MTLSFAIVIKPPDVRRYIAGRFSILRAETHCIQVLAGVIRIFLLLCIISFDVEFLTGKYLQRFCFFPFADHNIHVTVVSPLLNDPAFKR